MFKSLCLGAVCLISHACTFNSVSNSDVDNNNNNDSNSYLRLDNPKSAYFNTLVNGIYNFKDEFDFSIFDIRDIGGAEIVFDDNTEFLVPFTYNANNEPSYYLSSITYEIGDLEASTWNNIYVNFLIYDSSLDTTYLELDIYAGQSLSTSSLAIYRTLMFYVINGVNLSPQDYKVFNFLFTHEDNDYLRSYSGYYSFTSGGTLINTNNYVIFGTNTYNSRISFIFDFYSRGGTYIDSIERLTYDVLNQNYSVSSFYLTERLSNYVYFDNVKMAKSTYSALNGSLGTFTFIPSTETSDFEDLLFGIADSNIYMIASLFNFEMFGINLYIALSGLLTLLVVIFIIRKIW